MKACESCCNIMPARTFAVFLFPMSRAIHPRGQLDGRRRKKGLGETERQTLDPFACR